MFDSAKDDEAKKGGSRKEYLGLKVSPHLHNCHGIVESVNDEIETFVSSLYFLPHGVLQSLPDQLR